MKKSIAIFIILFLGILVSNCSNSTGTSEDTFMISFTPSSTTIDIGSDAALTANIADISNMFALSMNVIFDTSVVSVDTVYLSSSGIFGDSNSILFYEETDSGFSVGAGLIQTDENDKVSGNGSLFEMVFTGTGSGSSVVSFRNVMIVDENGNANPSLSKLTYSFSTINVR